MKKTLLFGLLSLSVFSYGQMTQANEATVGTISSMSLCDSFALNLSGVVGPAVTWDYSNLAIYFGQNRDVSVVNPSSTTYASDFGTSTIAIQVGNNLTTYYSSTASERTSQGFVFSEPSLGDVVATFDTDNETVATYPFGFPSSLSDNFAGNLFYMGSFNTSATGSGHASIDGEGTLIIGSQTNNNVIRYKLMDTSYATVTLPIPLGDMEFIREQYEYYDYSVGNLPVFIHSTITVQQAGSSSPVSQQSLVLSRYPTTNYVGVNELNTVDFNVYPNPATSNLFLDGNFSAEANYSILDHSGRLILTDIISTKANIDISSLQAGSYLVKIVDGDHTSTSSFVKQ